MEPRNPWIFAGRAWLVVAFIFLYLPLVVLILFSFQKNRFPGLPLRGFTWEWYDKLFDDGVLVQALTNSMLVSPEVWSACSVIVRVRFLRWIAGSSNAVSKPVRTWRIGMCRFAAGA